MSDSIKLSLTLPVEPRLLYNAWLDSNEHTAFTNSKVSIEKKVGSTFTARDGFISGKIELLHMNKRILLSLRTTDFEEGTDDSSLEVSFDKVEKGTKITLAHSNLPDDTGKSFRKEWRDTYFKPMKEYFEQKKV